MVDVSLSEPDGFDPGRFTAAPLQTEGVIRFPGPPDPVFARIADHVAMTDWVPLLRTVQVRHPGPLPAGQSMAGTARVLVAPGLVILGMQPLPPPKQADRRDLG
jgi:hypothetical protein